MLEELLVRHCAPTLAGLKTGSMFSCVFAGRQQMCRTLRCLNRLFLKKGLRILPMCVRGERTLLYVYRISQLRGDLACSATRAFLETRGYDCSDPERCVVQLMQALRGGGEFPHETGFFLGYPSEDVMGFINNGARGSKLEGCWKVYGEVERARSLFAQYKKCACVYGAMLRSGQPLERLVVTSAERAAQPEA